MCSFAVIALVFFPAGGLGNRTAHCRERVRSWHSQGSSGFKNLVYIHCAYTGGIFVLCNKVDLVAWKTDSFLKVETQDCLL